MKKIIAISMMLAAVLGVFAFNAHQAEARSRYGSHRIGGYTSHGKGSHYIGGYVR